VTQAVAKLIDLGSRHWPGWTWSAQTPFTMGGRVVYLQARENVCGEESSRAIIIELGLETIFVLFAQDEASRIALSLVLLVLAIDKAPLIWPRAVPVHWSPELRKSGAVYNWANVYC